MQLPGPLRKAIEQELAGLDSARLRAAAARLSERYRHMEGGLHLPGGGPHLPSVGKCGVRAGAISDDLDRAAYLAVRMPATFAAVATALEWTREALAEEGCAQLRSVLDLGSGPGTALWAAAHVFPTLASATAVERDPRLIEIGSRLAAHSGDEAVRKVQWLCGDLASELPLPQQAKYGLSPQRANLSRAGDPGLAGGPAGSWDLVVCAYALNEIAEGQRARLITQAWARCSKLLVVVEPGTTAGFGNVLAVRRQMLALNPEPDAPALIAPCPHSRDCPMAAAGDWCHFAARVERTSLHRRLKEAELGHEDEKFSYVAFLRGTHEKSTEHPRARVVRHPRIFSGYAQLTLCTEGELAQTTVTRSQKEDWRRLKRVGWGDCW